MQKAGLTFPVLSDRNADAIRSYDLLLPKMGEDGHDIGTFAEFLVDASGKVRWRKLSEMAPGSLTDAGQGPGLSANRFFASVRVGDRDIRAERDHGCSAGLPLANLRPRRAGKKPLQRRSQTHC